MQNFLVWSGWAEECKKGTPSRIQTQLNDRATPGNLKGKVWNIISFRMNELKV